MGMNLYLSKTTVPPALLITLKTGYFAKKWIFCALQINEPDSRSLINYLFVFFSRKLKTLLLLDITLLKSAAVKF